MPHISVCPSHIGCQVILPKAHACQVCQLRVLSCMQAVKKEVDTAVSEAKNSPVPEAEALWHHIYKDPLGSSVKGLDSKTHIKL